MKAKKQFFIWLAAVLLGIACLPGWPVQAAAVPSLYASADKTAGQAVVNVRVSLANNPEIHTLKCSLAYDSSILQYEDSTWSSAFSQSDITNASDTGGAVNLSVISSGSYGSDGNIVTVRFRMRQETAALPVTLSLQEMTDIDLEAVSDCQVSSAVRMHGAGSANSGTGSANDGTGSADDGTGIVNHGTGTADKSGQSETAAAEDSGKDEAAGDSGKNETVAAEDSGKDEAAGNSGQNGAAAAGNSGQNGAAAAGDSSEGETDIVENSGQKQDGTAGNSGSGGTSAAESSGPAGTGSVGSSGKEESSGLTGTGSTGSSGKKEAADGSKEAGTGSAAVPGETEGRGGFEINEAAQDGKASGKTKSAGSSAQAAGNSRPDANYKTGAGIGKDAYLILAVLCGILALAIWSRKSFK